MRFEHMTTDQKLAVLLARLDNITAAADPLANGRSHHDREIDRKLDLIFHAVEKQGDFLMALEDDLNNAVTSLATGFAALDTAVQSEISALVDAINSGNSIGALRNAATQAVANIGTITSKMAADAAALTASIPAATTVAAPVQVTSPVATAPDVEVPQIATPPVTAPIAQPPSTPPDTATTSAPSA